jgi:DNA helicase II / ATP-dependent DNA helicase PcrA
MSDNPYVEGLNPPQREAVLTINGPLLVLAGAGSGKTRVITHRIVHLIHNNIAPQNILAVTFTNKAAREMKDRVTALISTHPPSQRYALDSQPTVTTFHSLGVRLLREHHATLNLKRHFVIYDRTDSLKAIKTATEQAGYNPKEFEPKKTLSKISKAKGDAVSQQQFSENASRYLDKVASEIWKNYDVLLSKNQALDFDDLLVKTLFLLKNYPHVREVIQNRFQYSHVDEYQDTNKIQFEIVRLIAGDKKNICAVGDIDQSIYSWRGADIKNVLQFEKVFPNTKVILLEENYRSTKTIIGASNDIISKNKNRVEKNVFTSNTEGHLIELFAAMNGNDEADYIAKTTSELIKAGEKASNICILYRTNFQSRALEEAFMQHDIPYQLLGTKFFERKEIKDVLSYLRLALNPDNTADLVRVINEPTRGIGKVTMLKVVEGKRNELHGATAEKVARFDTLMQDIADAARTKNISETISFIISRTGIEAMLRKEGTEDDLSRLENLRELVSLATRFDTLDPESAVEALLETAALQSDQDELDSSTSDAVKMMTVHAAKGLEFRIVFISGMEEGLFPHERLDEIGIDHEEERRLFYVALTRAEKRVFLTYAHIRTIFGSQKVNIPSSFLNDISQAYIAKKSGDGNHHTSGYETTIYLD